MNNLCNTDAKIMLQSIKANKIKKINKKNISPGKKTGHATTKTNYKSGLVHVTSAGMKRNKETNPKKIK